MSKKVYVCSECGFIFPDELYHLIESNYQVFCERCGAPFSLERFKIKESEKLISEPKVLSTFSDKIDSNFNSLIQFFNYISFIPILFASIFFLLFIPGVPKLFLVISALFIALYDIIYIVPRVKRNRHNEVITDSIGWGILGCILFGTGVILLIKGLLIFFYVIYNEKDKHLKYYDFGLLLKNSLNNYSALAGFVIILIAFPRILERFHNVFIILLLLAIFALLIDLILKKKLRDKDRFYISDSALLITIGIIGTIFSAAGIFILLKGILILFLIFGEPSEIKEAIEIEEKPVYQPPQVIEPREQIYEIPSIKEVPEKLVEVEKEKKVKKEIIKIGKEKEPSFAKEKEIELKLHESLLPVKDKKDKELVKQYFSKIFTVLSKDLRQQITDLKIPKKQRKELLRELAFLSAEEQIKYIEAIVSLYKERLPIKLIERIKKLPNVKPKYYKKIAEQLKFMDFDEQVRFVKFLESNAK